MKNNITVHCLVKNEENFIWYAIKSVVDFVDKVIIFDTGSADKTVEIIKDLTREYPDKIIFEEKGECDKKKHTELRNEMIEKTDTDWFMILDGDEVWISRGVEEVLNNVDSNENVDCFVAPFYLCVGDIYHYSWRGKFGIKGKKMHATPRVFRNNNVKWVGEYGSDYVANKNGEKMFEKNSIILDNKFWHVTHLERSSVENDYSSGGKRECKKRLSYFLIGKKIKEDVPGVFLGDNKSFKLSFFKSFLNFWKILFR